MKIVKIAENGYALRYAAGQYWLLDLRQPGIPYKRPMCMNEVGADVWKFLEQGNTLEEIIIALCKEYEAEPEMIKTDVLQFIKQLKAYGVKIEG